MNSINKILCNIQKKYQIFEKYFRCYNYVSRVILRIYLYILVNIKFKIYNTIYIYN